MSRKLILLLLALALPACIERSDKVTLNPDGSGKDQIEVIVDRQAGGLVALNGGGSDILVRILKGFKGVDVWSDMTCEVEKDGRVHFKGTAYFKSIDDFALSIGPNLQTTWTQGLNGAMTLTVKERVPQKPFPAPASQPDDAKISQIVDTTRQQWAKAKGAQVNRIAKIKVHLVYLLPGEPDSTSILQPVLNLPGAVELLIEGQKIIDGTDKLIKDDAALKAAIAANHIRGTAIDNDLRMQALFGKTGDITATVKLKPQPQPQPQFDYAAQVAAARKAEPAMMSKLGIGGPATQPVYDGPIVPQPVP